jgi:hypothetical protein
MGVVFIDKPGNLEKLPQLFLGLNALNLQTHDDNPFQAILNDEC